MASSAKYLNISNLELSDNAFAVDVVTGLSASPKRVSPKYLYDERGSHLFQEIMQLQEYYPTQCEMEILQNRGKQIAEGIDKGPIRILELGAGDGEKTKVLLREFLTNREIEYIPSDISKEMVAEIVHHFEEEFSSKGFTVTGLVSDYISSLRWLHHQPPMRTLILFLGSSIGNFDQETLYPFLTEVGNSLKKGDWALIGFDLKKDITVLEAAYNDPKGITREFNLNLLNRINWELGGNFKREFFIHHAFYNPTHGRMESWLMSTIPQTIQLKKLGKEFSFKAWEGIHVESSYKFTTDQVQHYCEQSGFRMGSCYTDEKGYFLEALWEKI